METFWTEMEQSKSQENLRITFINPGLSTVGAFKEDSPRIPPDLPTGRHDPGSDL